MSDIWNSLLDGLAQLLVGLHDLVVPVFGPYAWGWGIILLTLLVRVVLLPLAIKQTTSMRAMQGLQPEIKRIQAKYKTDRSVAKSDPEKFRESREKQQAELQSLYKDRGVNPAAGCLPLVAQMPVFFALFSVLRSPDQIPQLQEAPFYFVSELARSAPGGAGIGAFILIAIMGATTFFSQRQMMANNPTLRDQPQQKIMLYAMPVMLTVFGVNFPVGVLLYWVTTNLWTMGQQFVMFRKLGPLAPAGTTPVSAAAVAPKPRTTKAKALPEPDAAQNGSGGSSIASAPKGAPTPKRADARKSRAAQQTNGKAQNGKGRGAKGRGSSAAPAKPKRG